MILLIEGADSIRLAGESQDASAAAWHAAGARLVGLAWGQTRYAGGTGAPGPLTPEGRRLVSELDDAGLIHDASHLAEASLDDLLALAHRPICASHSNCRAILHDDPRARHLHDRHIRAITARGGVIGIVLYDRFLLPPAELAHRRANWSDVIRHIDHVCDLAGACRHVGIGSDLDGGFGREHVPEELETIADLPELADALAARGYGDADIAGIMGGNWLEFFRQSLA
jgi:membrane dipeptidase